MVGWLENMLAVEGLCQYVQKGEMEEFKFPRADGHVSLSRIESTGIRMPNERREVRNVHFERCITVPDTSPAKA